ncbi:hypothetical protein GVAV_003326 [Gurleya vavrai]
MKQAGETQVLDIINENSHLKNKKIESDVDEDNHFPKCKICFLYKNPIDSSNDLIAPCGCKGSIKYVHKTCLRLWRFKGKNIREIKKCEQCCCDYKIAEDYMPHMIVVRCTTAVSIILAVFVAKCVISNVGDALTFFLDEYAFEEQMRYLDLEHENKWKTQESKTESLNQKYTKTNTFNKINNFGNERYSFKETPNKNSENDGIKLENDNIKYKKSKNESFNKILNDLYKKKVTFQLIGSKYYEKNLQMIRDYLENKTHREEFKISLNTALIIFISLYVFTCCWSFWPVLNLFFTVYRVYCFDFMIDRLLLFVINMYYLKRMYADLFNHVDSLYVFALNYRL